MTSEVADLVIGFALLAAFPLVFLAVWLSYIRQQRGRKR